MNGCFAFGLSLFGVPSGDGLLDRSALKPLDLRLALRDWAKGFKGGSGLFHFGGRHWSPTENLGYFAEGATLLALRKSGEVVARWSSLSALLKQELAAAETMAREQAPANAWA